jgi:hypothetical protein
MTDLLAMIESALEYSRELEGEALDVWVIARLEDDGSCLFIDTDKNNIAAGITAATPFKSQAEAQRLAIHYRNSNGVFSAMQVREVNQHVRTHLTQLKAAIIEGYL